MVSETIILTTVERVKEFIEAINDFDCEIDLISGRYRVNGKSIMGIFSLDLSQPLTVEAFLVGSGADDLRSRLARFSPDSGEAAL